jgi:beta-glucosidase
LGLFSDPYRGLNDAAPARVHLSNEHRAIAYQAAVESFVLLQNDWVKEEAKAGQYLQTTTGETKSVLPLSPSANIAWIGPYIKDKRNLIGNWSGAGDYKQAISLWEALHAGKKGEGQSLNDWENRGWDNESNYALGCNALEDEALIARLNEHGGMIEKSAKSPQALIDEAVALAKTKDVVVVYLGETFV